MISVVRYQVADYRGELIVSHDPDDDNEQIIAKAKAKLSREVGGLPFGYQSFKIVKPKE
jgi:hypothetical protein